MRLNYETSDQYAMDLVVATVVIELANALVTFPFALILLVVLPAVFALLHGALRYRWSGILTFLVLCLVVSNVLENSSILTGVPFGHYHYTNVLGLKLFLVPVLIGLSYFSVGYFSWMLSIILVAEIGRKVGWFTTFSVPFIASFFMVMWDLCFDPSLSTLGHAWIWEQGGGYFGVPITNYLGWFFTVYVFLQLFALFLHFRRTDRSGKGGMLPRSYYAQVIVHYAVIGLSYVLVYLVSRDNTLVTDAAGVVWHTASIIEAKATVSIFTMLFVAAVTAVKLFQKGPVFVSPTVETETGAADAQAQPVK